MVVSGICVNLVLILGLVLVLVQLKKYCSIPYVLNHIFRGLKMALRGKKLLMSNEENKEKSFMITVMGSIEVFGDETVEQAIAWVEQNITEVQLEITGEEW